MEKIERLTYALLSNLDEDYRIDDADYGEKDNELIVQYESEKYKIIIEKINLEANK